ncbi:hypothetical protein C4568_03820 [Candidatus Parcubacteria bacterium]|nr:MAG: hypothetical protein C4568_03820 [Candidatus Parcubacteria bacterium]
MKKYVVGLMLLAVVAFPSITKAQTVDLQAQIDALVAQVAELQKLLSLIQQVEALQARLDAVETKTSVQEEEIVVGGGTDNGPSLSGKKEDAAKHGIGVNKKLTANFISEKSDEDHAGQFIVQLHDWWEDENGTITVARNGEVLTPSDVEGPNCGGNAWNSLKTCGLYHYYNNIGTTDDLTIKGSINGVEKSFDIVDGHDGEYLQW